jgi:general secretion pathway protein D
MSKAGSRRPERNLTGRYGDFAVRPRRVRSAAALACAVFASTLALGATPADAATLNGIRVDASAGRNPRVILAFTNGVPEFKVFGNGTTDVSVILQSSTRGVNAPAAMIGRDPLKSISVDNFGDSLNVTFHESVASNVTVGPGPGQTLIVTISASGGELNALAAPTVVPTAPPTTAPMPSGSEITEIVPLKYADVSEIVGLLVAGQQIPSNDSFTPQEQQFGSAGVTGGNTFGGGQIGGQIGGLNGGAVALNQVQNFGGGGGTALGQQINENIGVDRRLNAIILTGSADVVERLKAKIAKIDVPLASVELETQIVELTDTAAKDIGIDFAPGGGGQVANATYAIKNLTTGQGTVGNLAAAVYAQIQKGQGRTIARPRITALDGTSAQIITGNQIPIINTVTLSGVSGTTSQVQYISVGVSLQIQPRINSDGFVTSHIFSQVSSVTGYQQGNPTLSQREASTSATVRDGDSFVIGGLLQQNELSTVSKLPGVGDIPLIGGLFHVRHDSSTNTNLYIIVTPHVVKNGANPPPARPLPSPLAPLPPIKKN